MREAVGGPIAICVARDRGGEMDEQPMWLDEGPDGSSAQGGHSSRFRRLAWAIAGLVVLAVVATPLSLALTGNSTARLPHSQAHANQLGKGPAEHQVLSALSATTDAGNFDFSYTLSSTAGSEGRVGTPISGSGVFNVNPQAMVVEAQLGQPTNLDVTVRVDDTTLYEELGVLDDSLAPPSSFANTGGQLISNFASLSEQTIGLREGAIGMIGLASPTGYLDLYQQDISGASQSGTGTVDGVPVTVYSVAVDPTQLVQEPGLSADQMTTAQDATQILEAQGFTGTTDQVSIDPSGYIREVHSVARFSDGGTVVLNVLLSNFSCAGAVLMPGQQGAASPPSGCTSPDTGQPPPTTTTTPSTTTTTVAATTTTEPTTTTTAPSTTTTTEPAATTTTTS